MSTLNNLWGAVAFLGIVSGFYSAQAKPKVRPNILFIEVDDLNYQYLSSFGSKVNATPNVDNLAQNGVRFENAVCQGMMCAPSRNSLITGLYPHNLGLYNNGEMHALPQGVWSFPQGLQKAGYYTAWIGKCHVRPRGRDRTEAMKSQMGFDFVEQTQGRVVLARRVKKAEKGNANGKGNKMNKKPEDWYLSFLKENGFLEKFVKEYPNISTLPENAYLDGFFTHNAEDFLAGYKEKKPFFLWLNYSVPHGPYDVAQKYHEPYKSKDMPGSTVVDYKEPAGLVKKTKFSTNEELHKEDQAGHCSSVAFMDKQVGRIISALKKNGQYNNTVIVFFSDQGVMLGDHQRSHKGTLFRQITNPALIISYPKGFVKGKVENAPVELIDLVNTTLDIAHAAKEELAQRKTSYSLLPLLTGKSDHVRDLAFGEIDGYQMATDGRYRYILGPDANLLFDDLKDPKNLHDIAAEHPDIVARMKKGIQDWLKDTGPVLPKNSM